ARETADARRQHEIADRFGVMSAPRELPLRDHLRRDEREEHRNAESREREPAERIRERMLNDHVSSSPGRGAEANASSSSGAQLPRSAWNTPARARIAAMSAPLHATPPPSTTRVLPYASTARAVFSTNVWMSASWNARAMSARSPSRLPSRESCARTAVSTAVLRPLNDTS